MKLTADQRKIDDLGFRNAWNEATVIMNIRRLEEISKFEAGGPDELRKAVAELKDITEESLKQLQIQAATRMMIMSGQLGDVLEFTPPTSEKLARPTLVPA